MESKRRTQPERSAATRRVLIAAARPAFAQRGYAAVSTPEIAQAAGLTRGALYHQFGDKQALFAAVTEEVERELTQRLVEVVAQRAPSDPLTALHIAVDAWLDASTQPEIRQILLIDAPTVLGWAAFRDLAASYGLGLTEQLLGAAIDAGQLPDFLVTPFAVVLLGALQEAAFAIAAEPDMRDATTRIVHGIIDSLARSATATNGPRV
jgi:AcrR family transcriptional regulator